MLNHYAAKVIENVATTSTSHAQVKFAHSSKRFTPEKNIHAQLKRSCSSKYFILMSTFHATVNISRSCKHFTLR